MSVLNVGVIELTDADCDYITGALHERGQKLADFVREALVEWASH